MTRILRRLTELQEAEGWLPDHALQALATELAVPLHQIESVSTFYSHFRRTPPSLPVVEVCRDIACSLAGNRLARERLAGAKDLEIRDVSCLGRCDSAPAIAVAAGVLSGKNPERTLQEVQARLADPQPDRRAVNTWAADPYPVDRGVDRGVGGAAAPYSTLHRALGQPPAGLVDVLDRAGLRGMGGAGFPTARKWSVVASASGSAKHVICNADESEPGTFKDREILHDLPHLVIEGMALAGYAVGAARGTIFIRHEYAPERARLEAALEEARDAQAIGRGIFGSDFDFEIDVFVSPGGYILGEETALLECLEDRRGEPRNKPPFPGLSGLRGQPTLINNVETLAHACAILCRGVDWWQGLGVSGRAGHKFLSVSGDVARPGVVLVPFGTPFGEILERCGGMRGGAALATFAPGGASSRFLPPTQLKLPLDFESIAEAGSMLGSGAAIFIAEGRDLAEVGLEITRFFRNESCGKCVPCRIGTEKAVALVESRRADPELLEQLRSLHHTLERTSICGLGQVALAPLLSLLDSDLGAEASRD